MDDLDLLFVLPGGEENLALPSPELYQYYKDHSRRIIYITDEIDVNCYDIIKQIVEFNYIDRKINPEDREPIRLIIASPGGSLEPARALADIIEISETPIYGIAIGCVASAASLIYLACHKRFGIKSSSFLLHKGSVSQISGSYQEIQDFNNNYQKTIKQMMDFYISHTSFDKEEIEENMKKDWYIDVDMALNNGIVNYLIEDIGVFI